MRRIAMAVMAAWIGAPLIALAVDVRWVIDPDHPEGAFVEVTGLPEDLAARDWREVLSVHAEPEGLRVRMDLPAMMGKYVFGDGRLRFVPRFALTEGVRYLAVFRPDSLLGASVEMDPISGAHQFQAPAMKATTRVEFVHPSADLLPMNLLKFYLHFSAPMTRGGVYSHVRLLDSTGRALELPFLELAEELWNPDQTRLTLLLDPGRIKRGLRPRDEEGPVFEEGKSYALVIDGEWKDARRMPLVDGRQKRFRIVAADETPPDPARWKITPPASDTLQPLRVTFDEPMDSALAQRMMRVFWEDGAVVEGRVDLSDDERLWCFTPESPWSAGKGEIRIQALIEDLAGNQIGRAFDVDMVGNDPPVNHGDVVSVSFEIR